MMDSIRSGIPSVGRDLMQLAEACMVGSDASVARLSLEAEAARGKAARDDVRAHDREASLLATEEVRVMRARADTSFGWSLAGAALQCASGAFDMRAATLTSGSASGVWRGIAEATRGGATGVESVGQHTSAMADADLTELRGRKEAHQRAAQAANDDVRESRESSERSLEALRQTNAARLESQRAAIRG